MHHAIGINCCSFMLIQLYDIVESWFVDLDCIKAYVRTDRISVITWTSLIILEASEKDAQDHKTKGKVKFYDSLCGNIFRIGILSSRFRLLAKIMSIHHFYVLESSEKEGQDQTKTKGTDFSSLVHWPT